jgi:hypothetical protein
VLRRRNYVTPTSYLELLSSFRNLLQFKREEVDTMRRRLQIGLDKLSTTKAQVRGFGARGRFDQCSPCDQTWAPAMREVSS